MSTTFEKENIVVKEKLLNMTQASKFLGVGRATLYRLIKKGTIPEPKIILGCKYYHVDTLKALLKAV